MSTDRDVVVGYSLDADGVRRAHGTIMAMPEPSELPSLPPLVPEADLQARVAELASQINADYAGKSLTIVCTLAGSVVFVADLMRQLTVPFVCTFLHSVNYGSTGEVRIVLDTTEPLEGRHVVVFEGVVVSGVTLKYVADWLALRRPASLKCCALVVKRTSLTVDVQVDYVGFEIDRGFAVGYGIADRGRFRGLRYLGDASGVSSRPTPT